MYTQALIIKQVIYVRRKTTEFKIIPLRKDPAKIDNITQHLNNITLSRQNARYTSSKTSWIKSYE